MNLRKRFIMTIAYKQYVCKYGMKCLDTRCTSIQHLVRKKRFFADTTMKKILDYISEARCDIKNEIETGIFFSPYM